VIPVECEHDNYAANPPSFATKGGFPATSPTGTKTVPVSGIHEVSALMTLTLKLGRDVGILDG
jgi:hypothetical protein